MKVSVIVPAYNEEKLITGTLQSICDAARAFHQRGWSTELIVCDNNSTDHTAELAEAAGARVVFEPFNQIARARNRGARASTGDWLIFVDADSRPDAALFDDVAEVIAGGRCLAGGVTIRMQEVPFIADLVSRTWNLVSRTCRYMAGSFIFCERTAFEEVGGFDETLFASEEIQLSRALKRLARRRGRRVIILHRHPLRTSGRKVHLYRMGEYLRFFWLTLCSAGRTLRQPGSCHIWYDGRR